MLQNSKLNLESLVWTGMWMLNLRLKIMHSRAHLEYPVIRPSVIAELRTVRYITDLPQHAVKLFLSPHWWGTFFLITSFVSLRVFLFTICHQVNVTWNRREERAIFCLPYSVSPLLWLYRAATAHSCVHPAAVPLTPIAGLAVCLLGDE